MSTHPLVSIIVPCYNEQATIQLLLEAIYQQTYPRLALEVIIADGMSIDQTRDVIASFAQDHPKLPVRIVDNPRRIIPAGLNLAIQDARGEIIIRLDAHSAPEPAYVEQSVSDLQAGLGDNVGGVWQIQPGGSGWAARAIAAAAAHPLGVGDARYRYTDRAQAVDTVPFGAYYRVFVERLPRPSDTTTGPYDESLLTNEDYEFNTRIRQAGGVIWLDPQIRSAYFARPNYASLWKQYWRYGYWKQRMLRRYPETIRWRQALPPLFVLTLILLLLAGLLFTPAGWLLLVILGVYSLVLLLAGGMAAWQRKDITLLIGLPLAIASMHLAWGGAFLWSLIHH